MRAHRIVLGLALAAGSTLAVAQGAWADGYRGTWEQQMACTGDVWRLCSDQIPDVNGIVACLRRNTPNLSDGCRAVFQSNNSMPRPARPGGSAAPSQTAPAPPQGERL
jgi:hypothetical protein